MIPASVLFDQSTLALLRDHDPVVQRYRTFFALIDWTVVEQASTLHSQPGPRPHPATVHCLTRIFLSCLPDALLSSSSLTVQHGLKHVRGI